MLLPIAGVFLATFLVILFFSKKYDYNKETKIYTKMLIVNFMYSLTCIIGYLYAKSIGNEIVIGYIQKFYMLTMLLLIVYILIYNLNLLNFSKQNIFRNLIWMIYAVFGSLTIILPIQVINYDDILDGGGLAYNIVILATIFYFLCIVISCIYFLIKNKRAFSKDIPFITLILLYLIGLFVRKYFPSIMFENFFFSFMLLIMYHTIENPDVKMLNEITLAKNELEQANQIKSDFISSMSHEIRTPVNAIMGLGSLLLEESDLNNCRDDIKDMIDSSQKLLSITDKMFEIYTLEKQPVEDINIIYNPKKEIEKVIELYLPRITDKNLILNNNIKEMTDVYGNLTVLKKVLSQIIDNAIKFTSKGSITIHSELENNNLKIEIEDTGIGIKEEEIQNIFTPFKKTSATKNSSYSGVGVGLSITKSLLEKVNGEIKVFSKNENGTKVILSLPIEKRERQS